MGTIDRNLQKQVLENLMEAYPNHLPSETYKSITNLFADDDSLVGNLLYLEDHGLIYSGLKRSFSGYSISSSAIKITAKGIDFLQQDGGLSAILNVTTIKFHREAVVVLEDLIALSSMTSEEKAEAKSTLGELSLEALKVVVQTATTAGLAAITK